MMKLVTQRDLLSRHKAQAESKPNGIKCNLIMGLFNDGDIYQPGIHSMIQAINVSAGGVVINNLLTLARKCNLQPWKS